MLVGSDSGRLQNTQRDASTGTTAGGCQPTAASLESCLRGSFGLAGRRLSAVTAQADTRMLTATVTPTALITKSR